MEAILLIVIGTAIIITGSLLFLRHYEKTHPKTK
jgi:multisubunit Na+/H+ antiporter MnhG subunit